MNGLKVVANDMLPVYENNKGEKFVDARELHSKLLSKQEFSNWIKRRIENYGFIESEDFLTTLSKSSGGRPSVEYTLTLDTGKEIAMVENNEIGRAIRKYFIEVEKKVKQMVVPSYMIDDPIKRAEKWIEERKQYQAIETKAAVLEQRVSEYEPKISYLDTILNTKDTVTITQIADDYGMTGQKFNKLLHEIGIQYKLNGQWLLYSKFKGEGYTKSQTLDVTKNDGSTKVVMNTRWTQKGRLFLYEKLKAYDVMPLMDQDLDKSIRLAK